MLLRVALRISICTLKPFQQNLAFLFIHLRSGLDAFCSFVEYFDFAFKMAAIKGTTYEMISSDKYDEFLKAVGVGLVQRSMASKVSPTMSWSEENGKWTQKTKTTLKSFHIDFILGEEFEEELADGRKCKAVITIDGNTLTHKQKMGDLDAVVTREFNGKEMISTFKSGDVVAKRVFRKV